MPHNLLLFSFVCCFVAAYTFNLFEPQCPKSAVEACMGKVEKRADEPGFCDEARAALNCVTSILHVCYTKNEPGFLEALGNYDIAGLYQRMVTVCN